MILIKKIHPCAVMPVYGSSEAACMDVSCVEDFSLTHGETKVVKTGLKFQYIPNDLKIHVYSRSGLAAKNGIHVLNAPGVIDSDYRGELMIILHNIGATKNFVAGDRVAQIAIEKAYKISIEESEDEVVSMRGSGGLGSTGITLLNTPFIATDEK